MGNSVPEKTNKQTNKNEAMKDKKKKKKIKSNAVTTLHSNS